MTGRGLVLARIDMDAELTGTGSLYVHSRIHYRSAKPGGGSTLRALRPATAALRQEWPYRVRHDRSLSRWTRASSPTSNAFDQYLAAAGAINFHSR
jgi:hypothetical protein